MGRNEEIHKILEKLLDPDIHSLALLGEPGIGKTSIAKAVANFLRYQNMPFLQNGVLFLTPHNISSFEQLESIFLQEFSSGIESENL